MRWISPDIQTTQYRVLTTVKVETVRADACKVEEGTLVFELRGGLVKAFGPHHWISFCIDR